MSFPLLIAILSFFIQLWDKFKSLLSRFFKPGRSLHLNKETKRLAISPILQRNNWKIWTHKGKPAISLNAYFTVTNESDTFNNTITSVWDKKHRTYGYATLYMGEYGMRQSLLMIPPNTISRLEANFFLNNKTVKEGENIKLDLIFYDTYYNTYRIKNIIFEYIQRNDFTSIDDNSQQPSKLN